jgi:hypothetical protein
MSLKYYINMFTISIPKTFETLHLKDYVYGDTLRWGLVGLKEMHMCVNLHEA